MGKNKVLSILFTIYLLTSLIFPMCANEVYAENNNEIILNFENGIIHDGYV